MSPINLADLPSNQPAPTGLCQIKRGASNVGITYNNTIGVKPLEDGVGNPMRIAITPARAGLWLIRAETIWSSPDAIWTYHHWAVRCVPLDALGFGDDRNHHSMHSALGWTEGVINTAYQLNAGVAYYAEMYWPASCSGYNMIHFAGPDYHCIMGEFIEGMI